MTSSLKSQSLTFLRNVQTPEVGVCLTSGPSRKQAGLKGGSHRSCDKLTRNYPRVNLRVALAAISFDSAFHASLGYKLWKRKKLPSKTPSLPPCLRAPPDSPLSPGPPACHLFSWHQLRGREQAGTTELLPRPHGSLPTPRARLSGWTLGFQESCTDGRRLTQGSPSQQDRITVTLLSSTQRKF